MSSQYNKTPVILDGDPGHDDAIAWVLAYARKELDILGITSVSGNAPLEKTTKNMLQIATLLGMKNIPLASGAARPLVREPFAAPSVHGESGLDGPVLPEPQVSLSKQNAVELMAELISGSELPVTLIPTGPLTNIATFLMTYPELKASISQISLMGGGLYHGNWTPAAEFNILCDPEAAKIVFESGIPIIMAGLDVTEKALITPEDTNRIRKTGNKVSYIVADWLEFFYNFHKALGYPGAPVHDAVSVAAITNPEILTTTNLYVEVETFGEYCTGATVGDFYNISGKPPNVTAIMDINREAFAQLIVDACEYFSGGQ